jgi:pimeloyl-ACP methyl ester carboxylesterase
VRTPPALARELAAGLPDASLVEIAGCAHCPPLERPGEFLKAVGPHLGLG